MDIHSLFLGAAHSPSQKSTKNNKPAKSPGLTLPFRPLTGVARGKKDGVVERRMALGLGVLACHLQPAALCDLDPILIGDLAQRWTPGDR